MSLDIPFSMIENITGASESSLHLSTLGASLPEMTTLTMENSSVLSNTSGRISTSETYSHGYSKFIIATMLLYVPGSITNILSLRLIVRDIRFIEIPTNMLLFTLCFTDLIAVINAAIWHAVLSFSPGLSLTMCAVKSFFNPFFPMYSGMISMLMAVDRFLAFVQPFLYARYISCSTWRKVAVAMAVIFGFVCLFPFMGLGELSNSCSSLTYHEDPIKRVFILMYVFFGMAIVLTIVICNASVLISLIQMKKRVALAKGTGNNETEKKSLEVEFAKIVGFLTCTFLVCWTPYHIAVLYKAFNLNMSLQVVGFIHLLAGMNYLTDPLVYLLARKAYRNKLVSAIRKCSRKCRRNN